MNLMVLSHEWTAMQKNGGSRMPSAIVFRSLEQVLMRLNVILQGATLPRQQWTQRVLVFLQSRNVLEELHKVEHDLNAVLQDVHLCQGNALWQQSSQNFDKLQERFDRIEAMLCQSMMMQQQQQQAAITARQILEHLAAQQSTTDGNATFQDCINQVLQECQTKPPIADMMDATINNTDSLTASLTDYSSSQSLELSNHHAAEEKADLSSLSPGWMLDLNALECDFTPQSLIGEGGFCQVFVAVYFSPKSRLNASRSTRLI